MNLVMNSNKRVLEYTSKAYHCIMHDEINALRFALKQDGFLNRRVSILLSLYTYGYCMGVIDYDLSLSVGRPKQYELADPMDALFVKHLSNSISVFSANRSQTLNDVLRRNNFNREFVTYMLTEKTDKIESLQNETLDDAAYREKFSEIIIDTHDALRSHFLETLQIPFYDFNPKVNVATVDAIDNMFIQSPVGDLLHAASLYV